MATDWISTDEAAELSGYHPEYIRQLIRQHKIQATRKGTMFWVHRASILAFSRKAHQAKKNDRRYGPHEK